MFGESQVFDVCCLLCRGLFENIPLSHTAMRNSVELKEFKECLNMGLSWTETFSFTDWSF